MNSILNKRTDKMDKLYNWLNLFAYIAMVAINVLANVLPLGGATSGQISDKYPTLFTPAGFTFSIWGLIYVMLGIVLIRQFFGRGRNKQIFTDEIKGLFATSCGLNIAWILCWHFGQITGATLIIFALLINLIVIMGFVKDDMLMSYAFGVYTAWIIVASTASLFVIAAASGSDMISASGEIYAMLAIILAGAILAFITMYSGNYSFSAVGIWSLAGIIVRNMVQYRGKYYLTIGAAYIMTVILAVSMAAIAYKSIEKRKKTGTSDKDEPETIFGQSVGIPPG